MQVPPSSSLLHAMSGLFAPQGPRTPAQPVQAVAPAGRGLGQSMERKPAGQQQAPGPGNGLPFLATQGQPQPGGPPPRRGSFVNILA